MKRKVYLVTHVFNSDMLEANVFSSFDRAMEVFKAQIAEQMIFDRFFDAQRDLRPEDGGETEVLGSDIGFAYADSTFIIKDGLNREVTMPPHTSGDFEDDYHDELKMIVTYEDKRKEVFSVEAVEEE